MQLTEQQVNYFKTFGFLILRQHLPADDLERIYPEFNAAIESLLPPGAQYDGKTRLGRLFMDADTPLLAALGDDPRFADVAEQLLGTAAICIGIAGNYYTGDTRWHSDSHSPRLFGPEVHHLSGSIRRNQWFTEGDTRVTSQSDVGPEQLDTGH